MKIEFLKNLNEIKFSQQKIKTVNLLLVNLLVSVLFNNIPNLEIDKGTFL